MQPLERAGDRAQFGGKAAQLAAALAAGLPVPGGFALSVDAVEAIVAGGPCPVPEGRWAVRSSAVDEDAGAASFAGQHVSVLHVRAAEVPEAVRTVHASGATEAAKAYRARLGLSPTPRMAVVVQRMVAARVAGVMFTRHPATRADELLIESSWGLGEVVVQGLVTPDSYRLSRAGAVLERRAGLKDVEVVQTESGTEERPVDGARVNDHTLDDAALARLTELARLLDRAFEGPHDVEWALDSEGTLYLLQRRSITR